MIWKNARKGFIEETKPYLSLMENFINLKREIENKKQGLKDLAQSPEYVEWRNNACRLVKESSNPGKTAYEQGLVDPLVLGTEAIRDLYEKAFIVSKGLNILRATSAVEALDTVNKYTQFLKNKNQYLEYNGKTIGDLKNVGVFETGSVEWLKNRQTGIGGSDFYHFAYDKGTALVEFISNKFKTVTEEDEQTKLDLNTAIGRGNVMEEYIRFEFANNHPELNVAHCKSSWQNTEYDFGKANFDGLLLEQPVNDSTPVGIVEIKTGSAHTWDEKVKLSTKTVLSHNAYYLTEEYENSMLHANITTPVVDGTDIFCQIPVNYLYQILWYAMQAHLKTGWLVAIIDDMVYVEYEFDIENLAQDLVFEDCFEKASNVWKLVMEAERDENNIPLIIPKPRKGFPKTVSPAYKSLVETFNGYPKGSVGRGDIKNPTVSDFKGCKGDYVGIDLETSGFSPSHNHIIQFACVDYNADNNTVTPVFDYYYDISNTAKQGVGYGAVDVHGIDESVVDGKPLFGENKQEIIDFLNHINGKTVVSHNFGFEERYLSKHMPGWSIMLAAECFRKMDTRTLCRYLLTDTPNDKMESFVTGVGLEYVDAHNALKDTVMMMEALRKLSNSL